MSVLRKLLDNALKNPRTTAAAVLAIVGAVHDPNAIDMEKLEIIMLALGLIVAKDAGASQPNS